MQTFLIYLSGIVTGLVLFGGTIYVRAWFMVHKDSSFMPVHGGNVVFADDGFAYWRNETGFYKAPIVGEMPDFENHEELDAMNVPAEELQKLLEIMSHLE